MTESEEMYILTIAQLNERGAEGPIPLSLLAETLAVGQVSTNQMVRKLDQAGLLEYIPYKGVELTTQGHQLALRVLRLRRLWEVFLVEHLGLPIPDADALACRMEHITPVEVAEKLSAYLGHPDISPQGNPIPDLDAERVEPVSIPLSDLTAGDQARVVHVQASAELAAFLEGAAVRPGAEINLWGRNSQGAVLLDVQGQALSLDVVVAKKIFVTMLEKNGLSFEFPK